MEAPAAELKDFGPSRLLRVHLAGTAVLLILEDDGTVSALEDRCSHAEFRLSDGSYEAGEVTCPAHGARFDTRTGKALSMPAFVPVKRYGCRVEEDTVYVTVPD